MSAVVGTSHVLCAIGNGTKQVWAAARAGISRIGNSHVMDHRMEPIKMGLVPEGALGELPLDPSLRRHPQKNTANLVRCRASALA